MPQKPPLRRYLLIALDGRHAIAEPTGSMTHAVPSTPTEAHAGRTTDTYENIYVNMPPFGLGKVGTASAASAGLRSG